MKKLFIFLFAFAATHSFGQTVKDKSQDVSVDSKTNQNRDTTLRVVYAYKSKHGQQPAFFINGKFLINSDFIKVDEIENINVIKRDTLIENRSYGGQVYIKMKSDYAPKLISLTDLKDKYTDFKEKPVVFMLDGNFINAGYDNYLVDENNLLTIVVDKLETNKEKLVIGLIKLLTKTEENIKDRNKILIRGLEVAKNK